MKAMRDMSDARIVVNIRSQCMKQLGPIVSVQRHGKAIPDHPGPRSRRAGRWHEDTGGARENLHLNNGRSKISSSAGKAAATEEGCLTWLFPIDKT